MKQHIESLLRTALHQLEVSGELPAMPAVIQIDPTKDKQFGDFATNVAMILAKPAQKKPREVAERLIQALPASPFVLKVEIAGPGFINFFLSTAAAADVVVNVLAQKEQFGRSKLGREKKVFNEFVSSNPTGPLHVGHGRHAAYGDVVSNLLDAVGFKVSREYYVNDAGRQMDILATSVWVRYLEICGEDIVFPANGYQGSYVAYIAKAIHGLHGMHFLVPAGQIFANLPLDESAGGDKELYIDALIERSKSLLGEDKYEAIFDVALQNILADMREDLSEFGVHYDEWFSERSMVKTGMVDRTLKRLETSKHTYMKEGALWFKSTDFGDEKDRVLVRSNGQRTYFANDVAHHLYKFDSGYDIAIVVLGSDHHGYTARMKAAVQACSLDPERLINLLVQFVSLYRGTEQVPMSTRGGNFVTLRELREEVGNDAARFFYVMRKHEQAMDFDLELAKSRSNENPVYYVQYAHARICSVFKQLEERGVVFDQEDGLANLSLLVEPQERELLNTLSRYPDMILDAALSYGPHMLTHYLRDVAADFHTYYNAHQFLVDDAAQRNARLALIAATRQILLNGFGLLGISAPETM